MQKTFLFLIALSFISLSGCTQLHQTARDVGNPIGGIARTPQAITEGVAEGYVPDRNMNPYGR